MPQPERRCELRLVLAVSLDGRLAPPAGGAAQIGGRGDRRVLEEALAWADGCLIGGQTLRLHGTTCLIHADDLLERRALEGRSPQPTALVVSRGGGFDPQLRFFSQPLRRWYVGPTQATMPAGFEMQWSLQPWPELLSALAQAGLERLLLLGGAELAGALLTADLVDQLQLTFCPFVLGGAHSWLPSELVLEPQRWQLLEQRPLGGDELLLRYGRLRG